MTVSPAASTRSRATRVQAVLLDCLGTLVELQPPAPRLRAELLRRLGVDVGAAAATAAFRAEIDYYLAHHLDGRDEAGLAGLRDRCARVMLEALALEPGTLPEVREAMLSSLRFSAYPDAPPVLAELRSTGVRLVATSNWDCSLPGVLARAGLLGLIDAVVASAVVGAAKPDPSVFRAALEAARCEPGAALFVGDSLERDVAGARAAGIRAVLIAREESPESAGGDPELEIVRTLGELGSLI